MDPQDPSQEPSQLPCELIPHCPVCGSALTVAHNHARVKICVCRGCGTSLSIPDDAWVRAAMLKRK